MPHVMASAATSCRQHCTITKTASAAPTAVGSVILEITGKTNQCHDTGNSNDKRHSVTCRQHCEPQLDTASTALPAGSVSTTTPETTRETNMNSHNGSERTQTMSSAAPTAVGSIVQNYRRQPVKQINAATSCRQR
jgi:hypothetical protein